VNHSDELWQEYDHNGQAIDGVGAPKEEFWGSEKICATAHVWVWRLTGGGSVELLVQRRAPTIGVWPNYWDISAAGHVNLGETIYGAAIRETYEEIGLGITANELYFVCTQRIYPPKEPSDMINYVLLYRLQTDTGFDFSDGEVTELTWKPLDTVMEWVKFANQFDTKIIDYEEPAEGDRIVPRGSSYFAQLFDHLDRLAKLAKNT
jgi:8-oxo-dGTP pyrophosphatase MutT (NUDIX family)